jgi:hypothetical protein
LREVRKDIGRSRRDQQKINPLRDSDVLDRAFNIGGLGAAGTEDLGDNFFSGERGERQRRDELLRRACHHHLDVELFLLEPADKLHGLVGCNSTGDAQSDLHG